MEAEADSAGVYYISVEDFEWRPPADPEERARAEGDDPGAGGTKEPPRTGEALSRG